jgi:hypothetical protein
VPFFHFHPNYYAIGPIIDPHEFHERFIASYRTKLAASASSSSARQHPTTQYKATDELSLLANVLVTWAASYGIDVYGHEDADAAAQDTANASSAAGGSGMGGGSEEAERQAVANAAARKKKRRVRVTEMVKEILEGVDSLALLRRPTWDGVRVLMLLMPLTEGLSGSFTLCAALLCPPPFSLTDDRRPWGGGYISVFLLSCVWRRTED